MNISIKSLLFIAAIAATSISVPASAYIVYGSGGKSCGTWTNDKESDEVSHRWNTMWLLGFVSGSGWVEGETYEADSSGMLGWVDNYCKENPLKEISDAAQNLVLELEK